jgi:Synergist-CTERM protein sorting domain-containing protein
LGGPNVFTNVPGPITIYVPNPSWASGYTPARNWPSNVTLVEDPDAAAPDETPPPPSAPAAPYDDGGVSGCDAGFGAGALFAAMALVAANRKRKS